MFNIHHVEDKTCRKTQCVSIDSPLIGVLADRRTNRGGRFFSRLVATEEQQYHCRCLFPMQPRSNFFFFFATNAIKISPVRVANTSEKVVLLLATVHLLFLDLSWKCLRLLSDCNYQPIAPLNCSLPLFQTQCFLHTKCALEYFFNEHVMSLSHALNIIFIN